MARSRNIKPGFFKNELLAELSAFDRLLFIGLWTLADREGRLEDRPKRIKMELFPCDDYDVIGGLERLESAGFLSRYQSNGFSVICIPSFSKHQSPHGTEKDSDLPSKDGLFTVYERNRNGAITGSPRLVNSVLTVKEPLDNALIPDSLIPDSLIPDSLIPDSIASPTGDMPAAKAADPVPHMEIVGLYNEILASQGLTAVKPNLWPNSTRATHLKARWREDAIRQSVDWWRGFFEYVAQSDFLMGRTRGDRPWQADLGWMLEKANFIKICEGKYHV